LKVHYESTASNFGVTNRLIIEKVAKEKSKLEILEKGFEEIRRMFKKIINGKSQFTLSPGI
jgi:hypothetical protein